MPVSLLSHRNACVKIDPAPQDPSNFIDFKPIELSIDYKPLVETKDDCVIKVKTKGKGKPRQTTLFDSFQATFDSFDVPEKPTITIPTNTVPSVSVIPSTVAGKLFSQMVSDHPNYEVFKKVVSGEFNREEILRSYKPLGLTAKLENSRGLADMAAKRQLNMGQFFTPLEVANALVKATALDHGKDLTIIDNACGAGNLLHYVYEQNSCFGVELDENAYAIATELFPKANIVNDDLLNQYKMVGHVDAALINPPFSLPLAQENIRLENAKWGKFGPNSSIESHIAALEIALTKSTVVVGAIVPTSFFTNESTHTFEKWVVNKTYFRKVLRIDLPPVAFKEYGTSWECSIVVYMPEWYNQCAECYHYTPSTMAEVEDVLKDWMSTTDYQKLKDNVIYRSNNHTKYNEVEFKFIEQVEAKTTATIKPRLPLGFENFVRLSINSNGSGLTFAPSDLLTGLRLETYILDTGKLKSSNYKQTTVNYKWDMRLASIIKETYSQTVGQYIENIRQRGIRVEVDPAVQNWLEKKQREYERNITPFENWQFVEDTEEWIEIHKDDGLRTMYPHLYQQQAKKLAALGVNWLWPYQEDDVIRMSLHKSNLYAASPGLGKTRTMIALAILYGCQHNLFVVEPKLTHEFMLECNKLGITDVQVIEKEKDIWEMKNNRYVLDSKGNRQQCLKKFNIISYRKIWSPIRKGTKHKFWHDLQKFVNYVALDEAHKLSGYNTLQGKHCRALCQKVKHVLLSTGTPVGNYPRNIYPLLVAGWGDGTQFNVFGYINPIKDKDNLDYRYELTPGVNVFRDRYIRVAYVSSQFADTLDTGKKGREIPIVKDLVAWRKMIDPIMIRRTKGEPNVKPYMPDLKPVFHDCPVKPNAEHLTYYRYWLEEFANWFKEQLRLQKMSAEHNLTNAMILAHITKLNFASTVPQSVKMTENGTGLAWTHDTTTKQAAVIELVQKHVENGEKVIVFSGRPELQNYLQRKLTDLNINGAVFTGEQKPKQRNAILDAFRFTPDLDVLLATTTCGDTGLNIPQASVVIFVDVNWTPSKTEQAYSRILRPDQTQEPHIYFVYNEGMIDMYMEQTCRLKKDGISNCIDGAVIDEFDPSTWFDYKDFTIEMLIAEGLMPPRGMATPQGAVA